MHESEAGFVSDILQVLDTRLSLLEGGSAKMLGLEYQGKLYKFHIRFQCMNERVNIPDYELVVTKDKITLGYLIDRVNSHLQGMSRAYVISQILGTDNRSKETVYISTYNYTADQKDRKLFHKTFDVYFNKNSYAVSLQPYAAAMKRRREESGDSLPISDT